jgi:hypothetical protein
MFARVYATKYLNPSASSGVCSSASTSSLNTEPSGVAGGAVAVVVVLVVA